MKARAWMGWDWSVQYQDSGQS